MSKKNVHIMAYYPDYESISLCSYPIMLHA